MRKTLVMLVAMPLLATFGFAQEFPKVLLLGDGDAETQVQPALEAAGHQVTFGGIYYDWDGVTPNGTLMPAESPDGAYDYIDTWTVLDPDSPLVAGVPASWSDDAGYSYVDAKAGTTVVIEGTGGNPLLSYSSSNGGIVVHLNHDMTYTTSTIDPNALQLLVNAVAFAQQSSSAVPVLDGFGLAAMILLLAGTAIALLRLSPFRT